MPLRRVRKAYEQVADQLRELIVTGELAPGERLPTETVLAREFGVSRATVREALRLLAAQGLIRTAKGAAGGSYVTLPTVDHISESLSSNIGLLADARDVTLDELLEARVLLEVPAARLAARRRREGDVERLRATIPPDPPGARHAGPSSSTTADFHAALIEAAATGCSTIAAQPVFSVLQTSLCPFGARLALPPLDPRTPPRGSSRRSKRATRTPRARRCRITSRSCVPYYEKAWKATRPSVASGR